MKLLLRTSLRLKSLRRQWVSAWPGAGGQIFGTLSNASRVLEKSEMVCSHSNLSPKAKLTSNQHLRPSPSPHAGVRLQKLCQATRFLLRGAGTERQEWGRILIQAKVPFFSPSVCFQTEVHFSCMEQCVLLLWWCSTQSRYIIKLYTLLFTLADPWGSE